MPKEQKVCFDHDRNNVGSAWLSADPFSLNDSVAKVDFIGSEFSKFSNKVQNMETTEGMRAIGAGLAGRFKILKILDENHKMFSWK